MILAGFVPFSLLPVSSYASSLYNFCLWGHRRQLSKCVHRSNSQRRVDRLAAIPLSELSEADRGLRQYSAAQLRVSTRALPLLLAADFAALFSRRVSYGGDGACVVLSVWAWF